MLALLAMLLAAQDPDPAAVRASVARSLPYLEKEGLAWIRQHDCMSCHHVPFLLWSHEEAHAKGVAVDAKKLAGWVDWSRAESVKQRVKLRLLPKTLEELKEDGLPAPVLETLTKNAARFVGKEEDFLKQFPKYLAPEEVAAHRDAILRRAVRESGDGGGLDTMGQLLLSGSFAGAADAEFADSLRARILGMQGTNGSWSAGGQIGRMNRTPAESTETTTLWIALAFDGGEGAEKARAFVKDGKPGRLLEALAVRLALEMSEAALKAVTDRQNADGGWASIQGGASDAFATGQALYALARAGFPAAVPVSRARAWLLGSQQADGSWTTPPLALTSPDTKPERLKKLDDIYRFWGTAWAAIGLARSLPAGNPDK